jgi:hypothetical protein
MPDESYEAGYRAGHLQGWQDAMAKVEAARQAAGSLAPVPPPSRLSAASPEPAAANNIGSLAMPGPGAEVRFPRTTGVPVRPVRTAPVVNGASGGARPAPGMHTDRAPHTFPGYSAAQPEETLAERQARREKRDRQNINITLYVASLLLVAAAALFIGTSLPLMLRFAGVCVVTASFYTAGFVLHARIPRLKPAAVAFAGTGLALVPVTGLALYNFALHHGPTAWLITSLIGTVAYVAAAVRLESRVLVYLSLTFVASTAWSGVSVLGGALVWYFAALIGLAVLLTVLTLVRPGWLPPVYVRPLMVMHPFVVPAVAAAATCVPLLLAKPEYALIMALCGSYFALMAAVPGSRFRLANFYSARISLSLAAVVEIWHLTGRGSDALLSAAGILAVQGVAVAFAASRLNQWFPEAADPQQTEASARVFPSRWLVDALATYSIQLLVTLVYAATVLSAEFYRYGTLGQALDVPLWIPVATALAAGFVLAARLGGPAEWAPVASLALAGVVGFAMGAWPVASMLALAFIFWAVRAFSAAGALRRNLVLGARVAVTLAIPFTVAGIVDGGPDRVNASVFALLVALGCQQVFSAVLERYGAKTLAPAATLAGFGVSGLATVVAMVFLDRTSGHGWIWAAVIVQLLSALAIGLSVMPRPATEPEWKPTAWEALPLAAATLCVPVSFLAVSQAAGNVALLLVLGYLLASGLRLPALQHRWTYWWFGRIAATVLVLTAFDQLQNTSGPSVFADEVLHPATVLILALAVQLIFPLAAASNGQAPRGALVDVGLVVLLQLGASAALLTLAAESWQAIFALVLAALCAASSGYVLRSDDAAVLFAPASLIVLLAFSRDDFLAVELLLGIYAVFAMVMVVASSQSARKGWYFVAARVLTAALAAVLSYDVTASPTAVSVTFALVLAAQHAVRWLLRSRLAEIPFQQAAVWITLAGQALLPLAYVWQAQPGRGTTPDGGRWVVLVELALLLVSAVLANRLFAARGSLYFGIYALVFGVLSLGPAVTFVTGADPDHAAFLAAPVLDNTGTASLLLAVAMLASVVGVLRRGRNVAVTDVNHWLWLGAAGPFVLTALVVSPMASDWVIGAGVLVLAAVCFTASHVEGLPWFYVPAGPAALAGATLLAAAVFQDVPGEWGRYLPWLCGTGVAALSLYGARLAASGQLTPDPVRRWSLAGSAFAGLSLVAVTGLWPDATAWAAACALAVAVGVACYEAPGVARRIVAEVGFLAVVAAVQRAAIFELDGRPSLNDSLSFGLPDPFWVAQWYVIAAAGLGALRFASGQRAAGRLILGAAAAFLTLSGVGIVFGGTGSQQLWVLVLFAGLLLAGLGLGDRLFVWWGAAGVAACILWAMRQYTFALLALIAVGLIGFAVWRLNRGAAAEKPAVEPSGGLPSPDEPDPGQPFSNH